MDKYIKKEEAIRALLNDAPEQVGYSREDAADCIRYMDTADVAPVVHGRWEWIGPYRYNDDGIIGTCSVCKERLSLFAYNYCPNCGARMDGDDDAKAD